MMKTNDQPARAAFGLRTLLVVCFLHATATALAALNPMAVSSAKVFQWHPFLAPFHAVVLHFPIGFLTMAFILEIYRMRRPSEELKRVTRLVVWLSLVTGVISAALGILRAGGGGYDPNAVALHRAFGLAVPVFTLVTLCAQGLFFHKESSTARRWVYRGALFSTLALLVAAGHLGGNLTHGSTYLVENAPSFVRALLERAPAPPVEQKTGGDPAERLYLERVEPVFRAKCYPCHGSEKQKGGYRLDQPEIALKGGKSGEPGIVPGDVFGSHLARLILLPPDHDDIMPPQGKEPLQMGEMAAILDWIRRGAAFPRKAASAP